MAYDAARGVTVLFGGSTSAGVSDETWEWNGTAWTQRLVSGPEPTSAEDAMAYDALRGVTVLFGRVGTWEWNGTDWTEQAITGPALRSGHAMAYDSGRAETLLFGGSPGDGEMWALSGDCPTPVSITSHPSDVALVPGGLASFSVSAAGPATSFRWRRNGAELADGGRVSGAATATLQINTVQTSDEGEYYCVVSGPCNAATSDAASLSCHPILLTQPPSQADLVPGLQLFVDVPANATNTYRWRQGGQNLFNIPGIFSGVTTRTLTILSNDPSAEGFYDVVVTNGCGTTESDIADVRLGVCTCIGDADCDGDADSDDIITFFTAWDQGGSAADSDGDGDTDSDDIITFFAAWDSGC